MGAEATPVAGGERVSPTGAARVVSEPPQLRDETDHERLDRNLIELLQEVRVVQTGVQVLFAFLLTVPFSSRFDRSPTSSAARTSPPSSAPPRRPVLLIAPTAVHRILFRLARRSTWSRCPTASPSAGSSRPRWP